MKIGDRVAISIKRLNELNRDSRGIYMPIRGLIRAVEGRYFLIVWDRPGYSAYWREHNLILESRVHLEELP